MGQNVSFLLTATLIAGFFLLVSSSIPLDAAKKFEARASTALLNAAGVRTEYTPPSLLVPDPAISIRAGSGMFTALITDLCVGAFELSILFGVILASQLPIRRRLYGCAGAFAAVMLFNPLRITVVLGLAASSGAESSTLAHDWLFRGFLVLLIVLYYALWFRWASAPPRGGGLPRVWKGTKKGL